MTERVCRQSDKAKGQWKDLGSPQGPGAARICTGFRRNQRVVWRPRWIGMLTTQATPHIRGPWPAGSWGPSNGHGALAQQGQGQGLDGPLFQLGPYGARPSPAGHTGPCCHSPPPPNSPPSGTLPAGWGLCPHFPELCSDPTLCGSVASTQTFSKEQIYFVGVGLPCMGFFENWE